MSEFENQPVKNPYAAPTSTGKAGSFEHRRTGAWVRQVRILAILMVVQGVLELLFGMYFVALGFFFPRLMQMQQQNQMPAEQVQTVSQIMFLVFMIGGVVVMLVGILRIAAGILGFNFRGRGLGITSHFLGLLTIFSFYCVITALPLCIYGCLVYFNREVTSAFAMRSEGQSVDEILSKFY